MWCGREARHAGQDGSLPAVVPLQWGIAGVESGLIAGSHPPRAPNGIREATPRPQLTSPACAWHAGTIGRACMANAASRDCSYVHRCCGVPLPSPYPIAHRRSPCTSGRIHYARPQEASVTQLVVKPPAALTTPYPVHGPSSLQPYTPRTPLTYSCTGSPDQGPAPPSPARCHCAARFQRLPWPRPQCWSFEPR